MEQNAKRIIELYLDWFNNFLSIEAFASHHSFSVYQANMIVQLGRDISNVNLDKQVV